MQSKAANALIKNIGMDDRYFREIKKHYTLKKNGIKHSNL